MSKKAVKALEFDLLLQRLSGYTANEALKNRILSLVPGKDLEKVSHMQ